MQTALTANYEKATNNQRTQMLMGMMTKAGMVKTGSIPENLGERSRYSCERYQFFLDAPFEISNQCCNVMKKAPMKKYARETGRHPITAQMASESRLRVQNWLQNGCNGFNLKSPISNPMAFWFENDVLAYARANDIKLCSIYGEIVSDDEASGQMTLEDIFGTEIFDLGRPNYHTTGCDRTGCFACGYGMHMEKESRLQKIIDFSNPKLVDWVLRGGHFRESDGMWEPYQGLGVAFVIEWINRHGKFNIWYPDREDYLAKLPKECWEYLNEEDRNHASSLR